MIKAKPRWIDAKVLRDFEAEGTDAHRLCTAAEGWVERFGRDILISYQTEATREQLLNELARWSKEEHFHFDRLFGRFLPRQSAAREAPHLLAGDSGDDLRTTVNERELRFGIDFGTGYSVGLFLDQRENRSYARKIAPERLLNCFCYTCSFSVAAAMAGAQTVNIDVSKKSLARGRANFALNGLRLTGHRFIPDDARSVLPRLARRGEKFDMIILDPPTFARAPRGKAFRIESDLEDVLRAALEIARHETRILLSTNCATLHADALEKIARHCLKTLGRAGSFHGQPRPVDFPAGRGASTIWLSLR
jgi:23S rRNA (cytosine1962-C5)-methyltransferase